MTELSTLRCSRHATFCCMIQAPMTTVCTDKSGLSCAAVVFRHLGNPSRPTVDIRPDSAYRSTVTSMRGNLLSQTMDSRHPNFSDGHGPWQSTGAGCKRLAGVASALPRKGSCSHPKHVLEGLETDAWSQIPKPCQMDASRSNRKMRHTCWVDGSQADLDQHLPISRLWHFDLVDLC